MPFLIHHPHYHFPTPHFYLHLFPYPFLFFPPSPSPPPPPHHILHKALRTLVTNWMAGIDNSNRCIDANEPSTKLIAKGHAHRNKLSRNPSSTSPQTRNPNILLVRTKGGGSRWEGDSRHWSSLWHITLGWTLELPSHQQPTVVKWPRGGGRMQTNQFDAAPQILSCLLLSLPFLQTQHRPSIKKWHNDRWDQKKKRGTVLVVKRREPMLLLLLLVLWRRRRRRTSRRERAWLTSNSLQIFFLLFCGFGSKGGSDFTKSSAASDNLWIWASTRTGVNCRGDPGCPYSPELCSEP